MLLFLQRLAMFLRKWQLVLQLLLCTCLAAFGYLLFFADSVYSQRWLLSCVLAGISCLNLLLIMFAFSQPLPSLADTKGLWLRLKICLKIIGRYLLCLVVLLNTMAILVVGFRVLLGIIRLLFFS